MENSTSNDQEANGEGGKIEHNGELHSLKDFRVNKFDTNSVLTKRSYVCCVKSVLAFRRMSEKKFSRLNPEELEEFLFTGLRMLRGNRTPNLDKPEPKREKQYV